MSGSQRRREQVPWCLFRTALLCGRGRRVEGEAGNGPGPRLRFGGRSKGRSLPLGRGQKVLGLTRAQGSHGLFGLSSIPQKDFPGGSDGEVSVYNAGDLGSIPRLGRSAGEGKWQSTPVLLPGKSHG